MSLLGKIVDQLENRMYLPWSRPSWWNLLVVLPLVIGAVLSIHEAHVEGTIAKRQETTVGIITDHQPQEHNRFGYKFFVNGKQYTGWESPRSETLVIGKQVTVFYDRLNPDKNALTDFSELQIHALGTLPILFVGLGAIASYIFFKRRTDAKKSS